MSSRYRMAQAVEALRTELLKLPECQGRTRAEHHLDALVTCVGPLLVLQEDEERIRHTAPPTSEEGQR